MEEGVHHSFRPGEALEGVPRLGKVEDQGSTEDQDRRRAQNGPAMEGEALEIPSQNLTDLPMDSKAQPSDNDEDHDREVEKVAVPEALDVAGEEGEARVVEGGYRMEQRNI